MGGGGGGGGANLPVTFEFVKFSTVIELCILYPKTNKLVLLIYPNEFYDGILSFSRLKTCRNSSLCKILIFKPITLKFAMWEKDLA